MSAMSKRKNRRFTPEQKADAVELARRVGNISKAARDLGLVPSVLHRWVRQAEIDRKGDPEGPLTSEERQELRRVQRELETVRNERDFLKKAAAFFAKDSDRSSS
jgi:transposase